MSLRTCSCDFPQKLHFNWPLSSPKRNIGDPDLLLALSRHWQALTAFDDLIDYPVILGLLRRHIVVPFDVLKDLFERFVRRFLVDSCDRLAGREQVAGRNFDVRGLAADLRDPGLMDHDLGVG